ncbi:MAG TPA: DNA polymerase III subunit epsilon [Rhodocyclaceae bacterium]|nr:DNA polymerase III subunit epsilon [Rhodocyclaceae bacterium]
MRQIVLDTETTGLEWRLGDRIIEVAGVEVVGRKLTGQRFHRYINPERDIDAGAQAVHGLTVEFLADKPKFAEIVDELVDFIGGAELVIHNANFDVGFLNNEFGLLKREPVNQICASVVDTLRMAREIRPGKRNNLDALCNEYGIDNSSRQLHGALLDAELLAEVYLAMTRGQESLVIDLESPQTEVTLTITGERKPLRVLRATDEELADHDRVLQEVAKSSKGECLWLLVPEPEAPAEAAAAAS